ncbi:hypothetical protein DFH94DRAFT_51761 [Russula ochroleuca]|uniref:Uncharacterized protein n=1 Tax=Russula ochroleuca TaxID=152965 RepID=A0A9P5JV36_9AGAM|nr:hypothetical protein DFH94DRAFT_51761 [Russula ochroleuca]
MGYMRRQGPRKVLTTVLFLTNPLGQIAVASGIQGVTLQWHTFYEIARITGCSGGVCSAWFNLQDDTRSYTLLSRRSTSRPSSVSSPGGGPFHPIPPTNHESPHAAPLLFLDRRFFAIAAFSSYPKYQRACQCAEYTSLWSRESQDPDHMVQNPQALRMTTIEGSQISGVPTAAAPSPSVCTQSTGA